MVLEGVVKPSGALRRLRGWTCEGAGTSAAVLRERVTESTLFTLSYGQLSKRKDPDRGAKLQ